jgi:L-ascorbate metabolism protein UlaG (beta-lactamase superfamily)
MKISKYIHSCILLESKKERLLIDPGPFTFIEGKVKAGDFKGVTTILFTHKHYDHYDIDALKEILQNNPEARVFTNKTTAETLNEGGISVDILEQGTITRGHFTISASPMEHEPLPLPVPQNTAFLINKQFLHPGDSLSRKIFDSAVEVLALPVAAPWLTMLSSLDFACRYKPEQVLPVHDGFVKDFFTERQYQNWDRLLADRGMKFNGLRKPGDCIEI